MRRKPVPDYLRAAVGGMMGAMMANAFVHGATVAKVKRRDVPVFRKGYHGVIELRVKGKTTVAELQKLLADLDEIGQKHSCIETICPF